MLLRLSALIAALVTAVLISSNMLSVRAESISKLAKDIIEVNGEFPSQIRAEIVLCDTTGNKRLPANLQTVAPLASKGNSVAQCTLGYAYSNGYGVNRNLDEAIKWYRKSADQGNAVAQYLLGKVYSSDEYNNYSDALGWYQKAAGQGHMRSQELLAEAYFTGKGNWQQSDKRFRGDPPFSDLVTQDLTKGMNWFYRAAEQGSLEGALFLGEAYRVGTNGLPKDNVQAYKWRIIDRRIAESMYSASFTLPRDAVDSSKQYIAEYERDMTAEQIAEAKRLAAEWKPKDEIADMLQGNKTDSRNIQP